MKLTVGVDYKDSTKRRVLGTAKNRVAFTALDAQPGKALVVTGITVSSPLPANFDGTWKVVRNGDSSGDGVRECRTCFDGGQTLTIDLMAPAGGGAALALRDGDKVEVSFTDDSAEGASRYSYDVYGHYVDAAETPAPAEERAEPSRSAEDPAANAAEAEVADAAAVADEMLAALIRSGLPVSLIPQGTQLTQFAATPTYTSPWANNPGPMASSTHTLTTGRSGNREWTENFALGGNNGADIRGISYRFPAGQNKGIIPTNDDYFRVVIDGILDTNDATRSVAVSYSGTRAGYQYLVNVANLGPVWVEVTVNLTGGRQQSPYGINVSFFNTNDNPIEIPVPAHTPARLQFRWQNSGGGAPTANAAQASLTVDGTAHSAPIPDGGPDPAFGQRCSPSGGGTVWVGVSAHQDQGNTFNTRNTTQLYRQTYGSTRYETVGPVTNWVYNALAYNPLDGYLYAISQGRIQTPRSTPGQGNTYDEDPRYPAGHLLRISPVNGAVRDLGFIEGIQQQTPGTWPNDLWGGITSGVIMADGTYIFSNSSDSGTKDRYTLDLSRPSAQWWANRNSAADMRANDYAFFGDGSDGYIYGIRNGTNIIERTRISDGDLTTFSMSGIRDPLGNTMPTGIYGTAWTFPNGNLGFGLNGRQESYQIEIYDSQPNSFKARLIAKAPAPTSQSNDAASNALVVNDTNLSIEKNLIALENGVATWEINVTNNGPCGSSGFNVTDQVPSTYTGVRMEFETDGWVRTQSQVGNTIVALHGPLAVGQKATLRLTARYGASNNACVSNTATVLGNEDDPQPDNNTASDGACEVVVEKNVVDVNGDGVIDGVDSSQPVPGSTDRTIQYEIKVTNRDPNNATTYSLIESPRFSGLVEVQGGIVVFPDGGWANLGKPQNQNSIRFPLVENTRIEKGATHTYRVTLRYSAPPAAADFSTAECQAGTPGRGLFNEAQVTYPGGEVKGRACGPIVRDETVTLLLQKVGNDNRNTPLAGAAFEVRDAEGGVVAVMDTPDAANTGFYSASGLRKGTQYYLVETRSPLGYSLLPQPIAFTITTGENGNARVDVAQSLHAIGLVTDPDHEGASPSSAYITIADFRQGDMPKTGGNGYLPWALLSALLVLIGAATARRKES
ncbi:DUF6923 family protein [Corynebacterium timonense]|uniref:DUF6923 family protein n=2 Tax=Corynebacterium timonense TaxID=441500 RepID=UPI0009F3FD73|nr:SpaA isopeptide-forming pilin-related protein [Corynebacterium timonense]